MTQPNKRLHHVRDVLDGLAYRTTEALEHLNRELRILDGHPAATMGDGTSRGTSELTATERVANARYELHAQVEQIRDDLHAIEDVVNSYARVIDLALRTRGPRVDYRRCDGQTLEGATLPYTPHSRDPENGWHRACDDMALEGDVLCPSCKKREARWRREHGLPARGVQTPASDLGYRSEAVA